jgi:hypothetical protein
MKKLPTLSRGQVLMKAANKCEICLAAGFVVPALNVWRDSLTGEGTATCQQCLRVLINRMKSPRLYANAVNAAS